MATKYTVESTSLKNAYLAGATIKKAYGKIVTDAVTAIGDLLVMAQGIAANSIIHSIKMTNTAAGTGLLADVDVVIRKANLAKPLATEVQLADALNLEAALVAKEVLGSGVAGFDRTKSLAGLCSLGDDSLGDGVALCILVNDAGTAATTINYEIEYSSPQ